MTPVGETLRRERLKRNLDLEEISRELKISQRFLEAIEGDQYDKLPGGVFAKSFARQYARLLGLDEDGIAGQVQQALGQAPDVPQFVEKSKSAGFSPIQVPKVDEWEAVGDRKFRWSGWLSAAGLVAVILVCSAVYAWMQRPKTQVIAQTPAVQSAPEPAPVLTQPAPQASITAPAPGPAEPAAGQPQASEQRPVEKPAEQRGAAETKPVEPKPLEAKPAEPKPAAVVKVTPPNPEATVHVTVTADEAVWVLARTDGKYAFSATMDPHTTRSVEGVKEVMLRLGNAGGVTISYNGKPIGPAGPKGQVRTLQFTSGGFQIVPAKPPGALPERL